MCGKQLSISIPVVAALVLLAAAVLQPGISGAAEEPTTVVEGSETAISAARHEPAMPEPTREMKTWDVLVVRPVSFVSSLFSTATLVATVPFAAMDPAVDFEQSTENLVGFPFRDTFERPLGDLGGNAWSLPAMPETTAEADSREDNGHPMALTPAEDGQATSKQSGNGG